MKIKIDISGKNNAVLSLSVDEDGSVRITVLDEKQGMTTTVSMRDLETALDSIRNITDRVSYSQCGKGSC
jgi:hypothetical protein